MNKNKLYIILTTACLAGYLWIAITYLNNTKAKGGEINVCAIKRFTSLPCPSCGSTRSVLTLMNGDIHGAIFWNPFGLLIITIMVISPIWILYDVVKRKSSLLIFYNNIEILLKRKWVAIPAVLIVLGNWIWNIYKGI